MCLAYDVGGREIVSNRIDRLVAENAPKRSGGQGPPFFALRATNLPSKTAACASVFPAHFRQQLHRGVRVGAAVCVCASMM